jgi:predicted kinase
MILPAAPLTEPCIFGESRQELPMEAILLIGLQASGKSSFYKERFFSTHVRISLDLLKTRYREERLLAACLETQQRFVIDNTNPTREDRRKYIDAAKAARYSIVGYYFRSKADECLVRNQMRVEPIPPVGILATAKKLECPSLTEGFDRLNYVRLTDLGFVVEEWQDEIR